MKAKTLCMAVLTASFALPMMAVAQQEGQRVQQPGDPTVGQPLNHDQLHAQKKAQKQQVKAANDKLKAQKEKNKAAKHEVKAGDDVEKAPPQ